MDQSLLAGTRILVVDDEEHVRHFLGDLLGRFGARSTTVESAAAARAELARDPSYEVVITDVNMPHESGIEVVRAAARAQHDLAVLVISGEDDPAIASALIDLGIYGYVTKPFRANDIVISIRTALQRREARREASSARAAAERDMQKETVMRLLAATAARDDETGDHAERMSLYAAAIARQLGLPGERIELLRLASPMHDIGKIGIPDSVLLKPGRLTLEERQTMQLHPEIGHQVLANSDAELLRLGALLALTHHERYDGSGYPRGLAGDEIPLEGRIVAVADVFDALTSHRVYRPALSVEQALAMMRSERGGHFDPDVFAAFEAALPEILAIRSSAAGLAA